MRTYNTKDFDTPVVEEEACVESAGLTFDYDEIIM